MLAISFDKEKDCNLINFLERKKLPTYNDVNGFLDRLTASVLSAKEEYHKQLLQEGGVFLSYNSKDREYARNLFFRMEKEGIKVWFDEYDLKVGDKYTEVICKAIHNCAIFMPLLSPNCINDTQLPPKIANGKYDQNKEPKIYITDLKEIPDDSNKEFFRYYRDVEWAQARYTLRQQKKEQNQTNRPIETILIFPVALPGYDFKNGFSEDISSAFKGIVKGTTLEEYSLGSIERTINKVKLILGIDDD